MPVLAQGSPRFLSVVGTRPNIVKMAPVVAELRRRMPDARHVVVHTGQHYDRLLSDVFVEELDLPPPDYALGVGPGTHAEQTARVLERLEPVLIAERPDLVLVPGDVNSTLAAALAAAKLAIPLAHVESGLRSFDSTMPEEINRVLTDRLSELLFLHSDEAVDNLWAEGVPGDRVHFVGNTMIDTLVALEPRFRSLDTATAHGVRPGEFLLVTLHRPALVDGDLLDPTIDALGAVACELPVVFPVHPRTRKAIGGREIPAGIRLLQPLGYFEFLSLACDAAGVLTDSGGVQEETTYLHVPCFTLRANTERPITITRGTNTLLGLEPERIREVPALLAARDPAPAEPPPLWDGHAAERIVDVLERIGYRDTVSAAQ
jgi:UDP-N-acetylglucosamine 2-epimerase (non-hydrolysing)